MLGNGRKSPRNGNGGGPRLLIHGINLLEQGTREIRVLDFGNAVPVDVPKSGLGDVSQPGLCADLEPRGEEEER